MFIRGAIFLADNFEFKDGMIGKKLLVLLNNPSMNDPFFIVKTTSQQHFKPKTAGCISDYHKTFFIQANSDYFEKDTWIQLDDYFLIESQTMMSYKNIGQITTKTIEKIVKCFLQINELDLSPKMRRYLIPSIEDGINLLAEKFNKR